MELCLQNPGLLRKRQALIDAARAKIIDEGFQFVKGKSRSKSVTPESEPKPKRQKLSQEVREKRLKDIEEDTTDLKERISFKEKRISGCLAISDYMKCDEIKEEIIQLKKQLRELEAEKKRLSLSSRQSKWYFRNKHSSSDSGADNSTLSCSDSDLQGHTPSSAPSPLSVASFDDGVLAPCTPESLSPDFPLSQYSLFSPSQRSSEGTATASLDDHSSDDDVQIVSQTPNGDGTISNSSTSTDTPQSFLAPPPVAPLLQENL